MDDFGGLRQAATESERERRRAERWGRVLSSAFLGVTALVFATGLTFSAAAYGPRVGLHLPLHKMGLLGELAAAIAPTATAADPGAPGPDSAGAPGLPSPIPSFTPTQTATATPTVTPTETLRFTYTPTPTATPSMTPTATRTPTRTLTPSPTPISSPGASPTASATPSPTKPSFPGCEPSTNASFETALLDLINSERSSQGLPAYRQQSQLKAAAQAHSTDMACNGLFSHTGSDGSSVGDRVSAKGYSWSAVGENIFASADTSPDAPRLALEWWMASPPSRANLLSQGYSEIGIGYINEPSSPFGGYFTVVFAQP